MVNFKFIDEKNMSLIKILKLIQFNNSLKV